MVLRVHLAHLGPLVSVESPWRTCLPVLSPTSRGQGMSVELQDLRDLLAQCLSVTLLCFFREMMFGSMWLAPLAHLAPQEVVGDMRLMTSRSWPFVYSNL